MNVLFFVVILAAAANATSGDAHHCVWYGRCGRDPKFGDERHILNCLYEGPPKRAPAADVDKMRGVCPHLVEEFADADGNLDLCCDSEQIGDMEENFNLPEAVLARCPTCLANFRKNFCDMTCRPDQSRFVNASRTVKAEDFKGKLVEMVEEVTYFVHEDFAEETFKSCKDVLNPATSGSVMNLLCGPWGLHLCTARRWFDYMGSTSNGYSPFTIAYNYSREDTLDGMEPHNPRVTPCNEGVGGGGETACSCTDCDSACVPPDFGLAAAGDGFVVFGTFSGTVFFSLVAFVVGSLVFLATVFVSSMIMGGSESASPTGSPTREFTDEI